MRCQGASGAGHEGWGSSATARALGAASLGLAAVTAWRQVRPSRGGRPAPLVAHAPDGPHAGQAAPLQVRQLHASAALLASSVLADSALEHYRGNFENPGMFTPLLASLMTAIAGAGAALSASGRGPDGRSAYAGAVATGAAGTAFHLYNIARRPGGLSWANLFYAAPPGAPAALALAGLFGLAARRVGATPAGAAPTLLGRPAGPALSALTGIGLAGTAAEAGLLHFRGAFHNPFMWLPVSVPPLAAALMLAAARAPARRGTRAALMLTGALGLGGIGFHAYGVGRQMGGWSNTAQNLLSGPPLSAPPSFCALALAGLAALSLSRRHGRRPRDSA